MVLASSADCGIQIIPVIPNNGQLTFDLMYTASGNMVPIECNPRIHSAVCTLGGHKFLGVAFTDPVHVPQSETQGPRTLILSGYG